MEVPILDERDQNAFALFALPEAAHTRNIANSLHFQKSAITQTD